MIRLRSHNDQRINQDLSPAVSQPHTLLSLIKIPQRVCYVRTLFESRIDGNLRPTAAASKSWGKGWVPVARDPREEGPICSACVCIQQGAPAAFASSPRPEPGCWAGGLRRASPDRPWGHKEGQQKVTGLACAKPGALQEGLSPRGS